MTLRQRQSIFAHNVGRLILFAYMNGYELTLGEAHRTEATAAYYASIGKGIRKSLHCDKLAIDLHLFKDGKYKPATESHRILGEYWKTLHEDNRWGGDFVARKDGNHYSMAYRGRA